MPWTMDPISTEESSISESKTSVTPNLTDALHAAKAAGSSDIVFDALLEWTIGRGLELYPAQEEAILELLAEHHVILATPTGSGKSMVALAMHCMALVAGKRSFYTTPIKALASEKFFDLCKIFGREQVGLLTGDAAVNADAPIVCCTAEVLANMALREGAECSVDFATLDEYHYFSDPERGWAWQVPLITMQNCQFLLMSATLGDATGLIKNVEDFTQRKVAWVQSKNRPVPLHFQYSVKPLHEKLTELVASALDPVYVVSFTQRHAADVAQALTCVNFASAEEKKVLKARLAGVRFDTAYGKTIRRYLAHGIGLHHAGLLPKYRLLVEQFAQEGLLKVICGTDTLGVGINVPLRTVLFTKLCKFDGQQVGILTARDFHQIAGRAGRKGFDDAGDVVVQAPEHVIENIQAERKVAAKSGHKRKVVKKKPPEKGFVAWDENTFNRMVEKAPEPLGSRFSVTHAMMMQILQGDTGSLTDDSVKKKRGYARLVELIGNCHERDKQKSRHRAHAAKLCRALLHLKLVSVDTDDELLRPRLRLSEELQGNFSLMHSLSLFMVDTIAHLDPDDPDYVLDLLTCVESILDGPRIILMKQTDKSKREKINALKAEGVPYEERIEQIEDITYPQPNRDELYEAFNAFAEEHPWLGRDNVKPKSIVREIVENFYSFGDFIRIYQLERSEGILLRYVSNCYKTMLRNIPDKYKTDGVIEALGWLRSMLECVDSSLLDEWQNTGAKKSAEEMQVQVPEDVTADKKLFFASIRAQIKNINMALMHKNYEEVVDLLDHSMQSWTVEDIEKCMQEFYGSYEKLVFNPHDVHLTSIESLQPRHWRVQQILCDNEEDNLWSLQAEVDFRDIKQKNGPWITLRQIGV